MNDPISCTILFPSSNSNGNASANFSLLISTCGSDYLNTSKEGCDSTPFIYSPITLLVYVVVENVIVNVENVMDL